MEAFDRVLLRCNRWLVIVILAAMALMVFANVALRFLTDNSILWVEEVSRYLMIWMTFLGAGLVLRYGGHIGIDALQESRPRNRRPAIRATIFVLLLRILRVHGLDRHALRDADLGRRPRRCCRSRSDSCIARCPSGSRC